MRQPSGEAIPDLDYTLNQLGVTLRSRLYEMCKLVEMSSDDFRKAVKQAGQQISRGIRHAKSCDVMRLTQGTRETAQGP